MSGSEGFVAVIGLEQLVGREAEFLVYDEEDEDEEHGERRVGIIHGFTATRSGTVFAVVEDSGTHDIHRLDAELLTLVP